MTREFMCSNKSKILELCNFDSELESIFMLLCEGDTIEEISSSVYISPRTVNRRISKIREEIESALNQNGVEEGL